MNDELKIKELNLLSIDRLLIFQKLSIKDLEHYIVRDDLYTKDDVFRSLEEILLINTALKVKYCKEKNAKKKEY